jgi:lipopolysaccharide export system protein LptC
MISRTSTIWFPIIVLSVLALITFWIDHTVKLKAAKIDGSSRHDVDYFLENFVTTKTDTAGNLRHVLAAVEMRHYPDDDSTDLIRPRFTQYGQDSPYTQIEGQRGHVSSNGDIVELKGNVIITRQAYGERSEMRVLTDYIKIFPNDERVMTDHPVTIIQGGSKVMAEGMTYNKSTEDLVLNSEGHGRVKGRIESPKTTVEPVKSASANKSKRKK